MSPSWLWRLVMVLVTSWYAAIDSDRTYYSYVRVTEYNTILHALKKYAGDPDGGADAGADAGAGLPFLFGGGYVPVAAAVNAAVADPARDPAAVGAASDVGGAGGAIGAAVAAYAPGGTLGAAHHDGDIIAGIWPDGDE